MKLFITGVEGFVGKQLLAQCQKKNIEVQGVDVTKSPGASHPQADIRSRDIGKEIPEGVDAVIHLAGLTRTPDCQNKAYECFESNVMATLNLMNAAQERKAKQFIFASTEWVYGEWKDKNLIKDEETPLAVEALTSEYALSKLVSEANLRQKFRHGFCSVTILRFGIIYGPREKNWSAVESLFHAVQTQSEVKAGSLKTGRCFIHVEDIVSGILKSIGLAGFETINLVGEKFVTLGDVIETSKKITKKSPSIVESDPENFNIRNLTYAKAKKLLDWEPNFDLEKGLRSLLKQ
jgi:nucleoside-diphosphate-sugar epimerase